MTTTSSAGSEVIVVSSVGFIRNSFYVGAAKQSRQIDRVDGSGGVRRSRTRQFLHSPEFMSNQERMEVDQSLVESMDVESDGLPLRDRYGFVLLLVFLAFLMGGIQQSRLVLAINSIVWAFVLLAALWSPGIPRPVRRVGLVATALVFLSAVSVGVMSSDVADGWRLILAAVAQFAALVAILSRILRHSTVTLQTVMGGVAAYALIAFVMSSIYFGIDLLTGSEFLNGTVDDGDYAYFSFVTLTTVGYGDITAATNVAKRLVVIEAFVGQVFIITFVARLVSLWGKPLPHVRPGISSGPHHDEGQTE